MSILRRLFCFSAEPPPLYPQAIDYAIESGHFDHALELATSSLKSKVPYVHLKHAMFLEVCLPRL